MRWIWIIFWVWVVINLVGADFDKACIIGRISKEQAEEINRSTWEKHSSDAREAQAGDRIFNRHCSETSLRIFRVLR